MIAISGFLTALHQIRFRPRRGSEQRSDPLAGLRGNNLLLREMGGNGGTEEMSGKGRETSSCRVLVP